MNVEDLMTSDAQCCGPDTNLSVRTMKAISASLLEFDPIRRSFA